MVIADLSKAERELWEAFQRGEWADLRDTRPGHDDVAAPESWERGREVRAEVIRALLLGVAEAEPGCVPAVRLRGARVTGRLDLAGGSIPWPLTCECCHFDEEIVLADSSVRAVRIVDSWFPAFNGARMRVDGVVSLQGCSGAVAVRVDQARVVGEVCLKGAAFGQDTSAVAVKADGLSVDGDVSCAGLVTRGGVSMRGLHVTGSLDLTDAQVLQPGPLALAVGNASIGGRFIGRGLRVDGELLLHDTTVTRIELTGARLHNPGGLALSAGGLAVTGGMFCSGGFNAHGRIWLVGARLGANLSFAKSVLTNPGKEALKLDRATIGTFDGSDLRCSGQISAVGIRVASDMGLERATVDSGGHHAIDADGAVIDGSLRMAEMDARGEVSLRTGHVGQRLILTGARLENPAGIALALSRTEIASDLFCRDVTIIGEARLTGTQVSGHLDLDRARLVNPSGAALNAYGAQFGMLSLLPAEPIRGVVDLSHARLRILSDDPSRWPDDINLEGLTYDVLEPPLPARQRLRWLARDHHGHRLQPYEQLASGIQHELRVSGWRTPGSP